MSAPARRTGYFAGRLNYTIGDEDNRLEWEVLPAGVASVLAVAGSGGRIVPLLARRPGRLTCVDVSPPQLHLTELRLAALAALELRDYCAFFGFPGGDSTPAARERTFARLPLSPPAQSFLAGWLAAAGWAPPAYLGRFEGMLATLSRINRLFTGRAGQRLFAARTLDEQRAYLADGFPHRAFKAVLLLLGNAAVLNSLLYRGDLPKKNLPGSAYSFYRSAFARLFSDCLARESYFLQMVFLGALHHPEGNPAECDPEIFAAARAALATTEIALVQADVLEQARALGPGLDFVSISDVPTFYRDRRERSFLQELRPSLRPGARVVSRAHLHVCDPDTTGFAVTTSSFAGALRRERTQLWHTQIYEARP